MMTQYLSAGICPIILSALQLLTPWLFPWLIHTLMLSPVLFFSFRVQYVWKFSGDNLYCTSISSCWCYCVPLPVLFYFPPRPSLVLQVTLVSSCCCSSQSCLSLCLSHACFVFLFSFSCAVSEWRFLIFLLFFHFSFVHFFQLSNDFFVHFSVSIVSFLLVNFSLDSSYLFFFFFFHSLLFLFIHLQHLSISLSVLCFSCSFVFSLFLLFPLLAYSCFFSVRCRLSFSRISLVACLCVRLIPFPSLSLLYIW